MMYISFPRNLHILHDGFPWESHGFFSREELMQKLVKGPHRGDKLWAIKDDG